MTTQSSEWLISLLLKLPDSHSLIARGRDQPASVPGCPAECKDGVVVAAPPGQRYLGLDLAGVLHMHAAVLVGQTKQVLRAGYRAEVQRVGGWLWIHLRAGKVWCNGGVVIVDSADKGGNEPSVSESSGQEVETAKLPGSQIARHTSASSAMGAHHLKVEQNSQSILCLATSTCVSLSKQFTVKIVREKRGENFTAVSREWRYEESFKIVEACAIQISSHRSAGARHSTHLTSEEKFRTQPSPRTVKVSPRRIS